ncbi:MAG: hypothetical protein QGG39_03785 [Candidatus Poribacteria bacterium]|nr:hypothetical protein [Candidatus Poribacteria bacterium]
MNEETGDIVFDRWWVDYHFYRKTQRFVGCIHELLFSIFQHKVRGSVR